ncbi:MAG: divergent polysaccharide deacetylase family protein [Magnetococcales bacterium]|nr:divergent polysaccharide deacetylase family protein [Magnetococcales bacterium]
MDKSSDAEERGQESTGAAQDGAKQPGLRGYVTLAVLLLAWVGIAFYLWPKAWHMGRTAQARPVFTASTPLASVGGPAFQPEISSLAPPAAQILPVTVEPLTQSVASDSLQDGPTGVSQEMDTPLPAVPVAPQNEKTPSAPEQTTTDGASLAAVGSVGVEPETGHAPSADKEILYEEHFSDEVAVGNTSGPEALPQAPQIGTTQPLALAARQTGPQPAASSGQAPVAVIIDDLGFNGSVSTAIARLPADITLAILPGGQSSRQVVALGLATHKELMLHQPMEPTGFPRINPGPGALLMGMETSEVGRVLTKNLAAFPEVVGINNHMGSRLTVHQPTMAAVMKVLAARGLYFVDSRTATRTVAYHEAIRQGVPRARRDVFIDNDPQVSAILHQLAQLEKVAHKQGGAIGIGHPYPATLKALQSWIPQAEARNIRIVRASRLLGPVEARARYPDRLPVVARAAR